MAYPEVVLACVAVPGACQIPLTKGFVALIDAEDYERVSVHKWRAIADKDKNTVYAMADIRVDGKFKGVRLHRPRCAS